MQSNPKALHDLRPVTLTSLVMKAMERIIKYRIIIATDPLMDPLQFAYRLSRGVNNDFSSAFNTLQPHILVFPLSL